MARPGPHVVAAVEPEVALAEEVEGAEVHAEQALLPGRDTPACTHERGHKKVSLGLAGDLRSTRIPTKASIVGMAKAWTRRTEAGRQLSEPAGLIPRTPDQVTRDLTLTFLPAIVQDGHVRGRLLLPRLCLLHGWGGVGVDVIVPAAIGDDIVEEGQEVLRGGVDQEGSAVAVGRLHISSKAVNKVRIECQGRKRHRSLCATCSGNGRKAHL